MFIRELKILNYLGCQLKKDITLDQSVKKAATIFKIPFFILQKKSHGYINCIKRLGEKNIRNLIIDLLKLDISVKTSAEKTNKSQLQTLMLKAAGAVKKIDSLNLYRFGIE